MKQAIIIEDEPLAATNLKHHLATVAPEYTVVQILQGVEESVEWFQSHNEYQLVFMDIHLSDGLAFNIFQQIQITSPIIFTTAYDQYAIQAFKVNSIDYLLKPIVETDLQQAIEKLHCLEVTYRPSNEQIITMMNAMKQQIQSYQNYFLIPNGDKLVPIEVNEIAFIYIDNRNVYAVDFSRHHYSMDNSLDEIAERLDPRKFFRANRQYIVAHHAIKDILFWFGGKLNLSMCVPSPERIIISRAKVAEFKNWYIR